jgi:hypothetical protein
MAILINKFNSLTTIGTSGAATLTNGILNVPNYTSGSVTPFIPDLEQSEIRRGLIALSGSTTVGTFGALTPVQTGGASAIAFGGTCPYPKFRLSTTGGSTNSTVGIDFGTSGRVNQVGWGFRFVGSYIYSDQSSGGTNWFVPNARQFCGLAVNTTLVPISSTTTVQSLQSIIGLGSDTGDTNLSIYHNDVSALANKIDLGSNFPANKTAAVTNGEVYTLELYNEYKTTSVKYRVTKVSDGTTATGTITTQLPATPLQPQICRTSGSTSQNVSIDVLQLTAYTKF